jgi:hypothetical protein
MENKTENEQEEKKELLGFIVDLKNGTAEPCFFKDSLQDFYRLLNCRLIDIQEAYIEGKAFDFIVDDEGLLKENPKPTAFTKDEKPVFCGSLLVCRSDPETGREAPLSSEDVSLLLSRVVEVSNTAKPEEPPYKALLGLEF